MDLTQFHLRSFAQRIINKTTMANGRFNIPYPINEPVLSYGPGSQERADVLASYRKLYNQKNLDIPMYIGGKEIRTDRKIPMSPPHDHQHVLGHFNYGDESHVSSQSLVRNALARTRCHFP